MTIGRGKLKSDGLEASDRLLFSSVHQHLSVGQCHHQGEESGKSRSQGPKKSPGRGEKGEDTFHSWGHYDVKMAISWSGNELFKAFL